MKADSFEDLIVWQKSKELAVLVYKLFEKSTDYGFRDQILRAAVSVMKNIAEGFERNTNNEFRQFLFIAKGSCGEIRSMLYLAKETGRINDPNFTDLSKKALEISKMLSGLIKKL
jgi:four helix bundle protein